MRTRLQVLLILCLAVPCVSHAGEVSEEKKAAIRQFLEVTGAAQNRKLLTSTLVSTIMAAMKRSDPDAPPKAYDIAEKEMLAVIGEEIDKGSYLEPTYQIYDKYLSTDEIREVTEFYRSPIGKKWVSVSAKMTQESIVLGQQWGREYLKPLIQKRVEQRFKAEGIDRRIDIVM